jgi:hypothetical protein
MTDAPIRPTADSEQHRSKTLLGVVLALGIVSTATHYAHNYAMPELYPPGNVAVTRIGVLVSWPLLTAVGLWGYRLYAEGRFRAARWALIAYSPLGISTIFHFAAGVPQVPPFFFATIFTDFITGLAVLFFALPIERYGVIGETGT